jgi:hypothetical protein
MYNGNGRADEILDVSKSKIISYEDVDKFILYLFTAAQRTSTLTLYFCACQSRVWVLDPVRRVYRMNDGNGTEAFGFTH